MPQSEIVLWTTPEEPPEALQASECGELLDFARASCLILAQRQPGKFIWAECRHYITISISKKTSADALSKCGPKP